MNISISSTAYSMVKLSGESKVSFTIHLEYKIYFSFPIVRICPLFTNQPVQIHIYLIEMLGFTYIFNGYTYSKEG